MKPIDVNDFVCETTCLFKRALYSVNENTRSCDMQSCSLNSMTKRLTKKPYHNMFNSLTPKDDFKNIIITNQINQLKFQRSFLHKQQSFWDKPVQNQGNIMQQQEQEQQEIEHSLFEMNRCVNDLSRHRLKINNHDMKQVKLISNKLKSLVSSPKQFVDF